MTKRIYRVDDGSQKIAGVCGGIGEYFDIDPTLVRLAFILLFWVFATGIVAYIAAWFIMPTKSEVMGF